MRNIGYIYNILNIDDIDNIEKIDNIDDTDDIDNNDENNQGARNRRLCRGKIPPAGHRHHRYLHLHHHQLITIFNVSMMNMNHKKTTGEKEGSPRGRSSSLFDPVGVCG